MKLKKLDGSKIILIGRQNVKRNLCVLLLSVSMLIPIAVFGQEDGWKYLKWGMSVEEVKKAIILNEFVGDQRLCRGDEYTKCTEEIAEKRCAHLKDKDNEHDYCISIETSNLRYETPPDCAHLALYGCIRVEKVKMDFWYSPDKRIVWSDLPKNLSQIIIGNDFASALST